MTARFGNITKRPARVAFLGAAVAAAFAAGIAPALAATPTTWTVSPGGSYTATSTNVAVDDNGLTGTCDGKAAGTLASTTGNPGNVGTINNPSGSSTIFTNCTGVLGPMTITTTTPWKLEATGYSSGTTTGYVDGVNAAVSIPNFACTFTVTGTANAKYVNSSGTLSLTGTGTLKVSGASSGCTGLISNGDNPSITGDFAVSGGQVITGS